MNAIADTGWIVALLSKNDEHHAWAASVAADVTFPALTCESVLAEAAFHTQNSGLVLRMLDDGVLKLAFELDEHRDRIAQLADSFADRNPDLADLCLIRMSEIFRQRTVLTTDATDFKVYRRNRTEKIPFLAP